MTQSSPNYELLYTKFFAEVGLDSLPTDQKKEMFDKIQKTVHARLYLRLLEGISEEERSRLDTLPSEEVFMYFVDQGKDIPTLILEEAARYREELITAMKKIQEIEFTS